MGKKDNSDYRNSPVAWFVVLEQARESHDFERAAKAKRQLERLGVIVKYRRMQRKGVASER